MAHTQETGMTTTVETKKRARDPTLTAATTKEAEPTIFPASEARANFMEVISRVRYGRERLVITNKGKPAAALVTMEDLAILQLLDDVDIQEKLDARLKNREDTDPVELDDYLRSLSGRR
jgi:prevent-host-death family protein